MLEIEPGRIEVKALNRKISFSPGNVVELRMFRLPFPTMEVVIRDGEAQNDMKNANVVRKHGCAYRAAIITCSAWSSIIVSYLINSSYAIGEVLASGVLWPFYMSLAVLGVSSLSSGWQAVMVLGMLLIGSSFFVSGRLSLGAISAGFFLCNLRVIEICHLSMSV